MTSVEENRRTYIDALRFSDESRRIKGKLFGPDGKVCAIGLAYEVLGIAWSGREDDIVTDTLDDALGGLPGKVWSMNDFVTWTKTECPGCSAPGIHFHYAPASRLYSWAQIADWLENYWKEQDVKESK